MGDVTAVRATITKIPEGYSVTVLIRESGRSRVLVGKTAASLFEAEAVTESFAAQPDSLAYGRGALPLVPGPSSPPGGATLLMAAIRNDGARFSWH
jgi:hypothetical protein